MWAIIEMLFVNCSADGKMMNGDRRIVWALRIVAIVAFIWVAAVSDTVFIDVDENVLAEIEKI